MDNTDRTLIAAAVRNGGTAAVTNIDPVVVGARLTPGASLTNPASMLRPCIAISPTVNPLLAAVLTTIGATRRGQRSWSISVGDSGDPTVVAGCLDALPWNVCVTDADLTDAVRLGSTTINRVCVAGRITSMLSATSTGAAALAQTVAAFNTPVDANSQHSRHQAVVLLNVANSTLFIKVITLPSLTINGHDLGVLGTVGVTPGVILDAHDAFDTLDRAVTDGYTVIDAANNGAIVTFRDALRDAVIVQSANGSPGEAVVVAGSRTPIAGSGHSATTTTVRRVVTVTDAHNAVVTATGPAVIDAKVQDIAAMAAAAPAPITGLRGYQQECVGVHLAAGRNGTPSGFVSALSPGLGKTVCTLAAWQTKSIDEPGYKALVVCPTAVRSQWASETRRFFPNATVVVVEKKKDLERLDEAVAGTALTTDPNDAFAAFFGPAADPTAAPLVVITSYEMATRYADLFAGVIWNDMALDEAAILKNPGTERSKAMWDLRRSVKVAVGLTGTPIDTSVDDLGAIIAWTRAEPDMFGGAARLTGRFRTLAADETTREAFRTALGPTVFRRDRSEIADELPDVCTETIMLDPTPAEKRLADAARNELRRMHDDLVAQLEYRESLDPDDPRLPAARDALRAARGAVLGGVTLARMAALDPEAVAASDSAGATLLHQAGVIDPAAATGGTKRTNTIDLVNDLTARGDAVLIMTDFTTVVAHLVNDLTARGVRAAAIVGGQTPKARAAALDGFTNGDLDVLVLSSCGREGLNLQRANVIIMYDLPWTPSAFVQRVGRAVRIGSTNTKVTVLVPIMAGTIEERVAAVLLPRAAIAMAALDSGRTDPSKTEMGLAMAGMCDAMSGSTEIGSAQLAMTKAILDT